MIETGEPARGDVRILFDGNETWYDLTVHPLTSDHGAITGVIAGAVEITRYKEQEARIRLLMRELTHRSKNLLTVIQAIMRQTASNSELDRRFRDPVFRAAAVAGGVARSSCARRLAGGVDARSCPFTTGSLR